MHVETRPLIFRASGRANSQVDGMTTAALGRLVGYSTQQVRDLERLGVLPPVERDPNGYRRYEHHHLVALRAYRGLAAAIGPVTARALMPTLVSAPLGDAAETIDQLHADLAADRGRVKEALRGLDTVLAESSEAFAEADEMTIGELARALDIRPSALRHWEHENLVHPDRAALSAPRRYGQTAIAQARIVAALRHGGYPVPAVRMILDQVRSTGITAQARQLLAHRLSDLDRRSVALLGASGHLHQLLQA